MKQVTRYLPLLLLAVAWELAARLELVSTSALPPLSDVISAWIDLIKDGDISANVAMQPGDILIIPQAWF